MSNSQIDWQKAITYILDELFFKQTELAAHCGVTQQTVSNWRTATRAPTASAKRKLSQLLENAGIGMHIFYKDYDPEKEISDDDQLTKELLHLFNIKRKEFILELARFEHHHNV